MGEPSQSSEIKALVNSLNNLLENLHLPIYVESPLDLTPSLLLAILECILRARLPISASIRESKDLINKVQAMKIFLGVLESDVIQEAVGLSDVDPRKLAVGEWDEVVFVGELLCWLGKKSGLLPIGDPQEEGEEGEEGWEESRDIYEVAEEEDDDNMFLVKETREPEPRASSSKSRSSYAHNPRTASPLSTRSTGTARTSSAYTPSAYADSDTTLHSHTHHHPRTYSESHTHTRARSQPRTYSPPLSDIDIFNSTMREQGDYRTSSPGPGPSTSARRRHSSGPPEPPESPLEEETLDDFELPSFNPIGHSTFQAEFDDSYSEQPPPRSQSRASRPSSSSRPQTRFANHDPYEHEDDIQPRSKMKVPIRYDGYINQVDDEEELRSFEASRDQIHVPRTLFPKAKYSEPTRADSPFGNFTSAPPTTSRPISSNGNGNTNGTNNYYSHRTQSPTPTHPDMPSSLSTSDVIELDSYSSLEAYCAYGRMT
ncbi:hypothetical protein QCA50_019275 [Cerrena zonata]|uniref:DUF5745 domain-containing protein n=1 Tax=Cerrena zonata TaxID=2478898 RepID=A0AAW0F9N5_9APHY